MTCTAVLKCRLKKANHIGTKVDGLWLKILKRLQKLAFVTTVAFGWAEMCTEELCMGLNLRSRSEKEKEKKGFLLLSSL